MKNYKGIASTLANYALSGGHEKENYLRLCQSCGENPLLLNDNSNVFVAAIKVTDKEHQIINELWDEEIISVPNKVEYLEGLADKDGEKIEDLRNEIETLIEENEGNEVEIAILNKMKTRLEAI